MSECNHDCSSCSENCGERKNVFEKKPLHEGCRVGKVYGVVSGKGGVGKSMVTSQLAVAMRREGYNVAILDADITGPSIPKAFGVHDRAGSTGDAILPCYSGGGIQMMSVNLLLEDETDPVIWRGPVIGGVVQQFWSDVLWEDVSHRQEPGRYASVRSGSSFQDLRDDVSAEVLPGNGYLQHHLPERILL